MVACLEAITARTVPDAERLEFMPRTFGRAFLRVESAIFDFARQILPDYNDGFWEFVSLSNGGAFLKLDSTCKYYVSVDGNFYEGQMSSEAAGITVCLFAFNHLTYQLGPTPQGERLANLYYLLRDYAIQHPEAAQIVRAID